MHWRSIPAILALVVPALAAQQPIERSATRPARARDRQGRGELARVRELGFSPRSAVVALSRDISGAITVDLFVRGESGVEEQLAALGARVGTRAGEWVTAQVPLERLREIRTLPAVRGVELAPRLRYSTSTMREIRAMDVRRRVDRDEFTGATGQGTIVGIVDSGIDFRHGDFIDDVTGRSRILYLWDHEPPAGVSSPPGNVGGRNFNYGLECRQAQLGANGSCASIDTEGHGTHVAGIAAGDGSGTHRGQPRYDYVGVAPEADLIVVKTTLSGTSIVDGVAYVFARAEQLGKPAVVNLSLGTQFGPHDGRLALSLMIDALSAPGHIIVSAAGNEGSNFGVTGSLHGEATVARGDSSVIEFLIDDYPRGSLSDDDLMILQAFYAPQDTFAITLQRPDGSRIDIGFDTTVAALGTTGGVIAYNGTAGGDSLGVLIFGPTVSFSTSPSNSFTALIGEWFEGATAPGAGTWRLIFRKLAGSGSGLVDAYLPFTLISVDPFFTIGGTNRRLVQSPADAERVIAVGAYHGITSWQGFDGEDWSLAPPTLWPPNQLLWFSSPGVTRDGRLKPEITAPGVALSSMSRDANFGGDERFVSPDSAHVLEGGTSMASPHVAGAVALMLSVYHHLTPEQALDALTRGARRDTLTGRTFTGEANTSPNASWGFGKLDVAASLAIVRSLLTSPTEAYNISQNPVRTAPVVIRFNEAPRRVDVYDFAGKRVRTFLATDFDDAQTIRWNLRAQGGGEVVNGVYLLVADLPSGLMRRKVFIVR